MKKTSDYVWKPAKFVETKKAEVKVEPKKDEARELCGTALAHLHSLSGDTKRATLKAIEALEAALALK